MNKIKIGIIGDYEESRPSHIATNDAVIHSAEYLGVNIEVEWVPTESLLQDTSVKLEGYHGIWCAPGSPYQSMMGALRGIRYARENRVPFIGTCGGFQHAVLEYAKNVLNIIEINEDKNPYEMNLFLSPLSCSLIGETKKIYIEEGTKIYDIYHKRMIQERYNCEFGLNSEIQNKLHESGFRIAGRDEDGDARILELTSDNFYIATLFQPQLSSTSDSPHGLVNEFIKEAMKFYERL